MEEIMMLRPKEVVCKWVDAFNGHDVDAIVSLYHDNATNHQVTNEPVIGIDAIREMFTAEFATADMTAIVENIFEDGQWAILEWKDPLGLRVTVRQTTSLTASAPTSTLVPDVRLAPAELGRASCRGGRYI